LIVLDLLTIHKPKLHIGHPIEVLYRFSHIFVLWYQARAFVGRVKSPFCYDGKGLPRCYPSPMRASSSVTCYPP